MAVITGANVLGMVGYTSGLGTNNWINDMEKNLRGLDSLVQASVISMSITTPPSSPASGACYIPAAGATGAWSTMVGKFVRFNGSSLGWEAWTPKVGWRIYDVATSSSYEWNGGAWASFLNLGGTTRIDSSGNFFGVAATFTGLIQASGGIRNTAWMTFVGDLGVIGRCNYNNSIFTGDATGDISIRAESGAVRIGVGNSSSAVASLVIGGSGVQASGSIVANARATADAANGQTAAWWGHAGFNNVSTNRSGFLHWSDGGALVCASSTKTITFEVGGSVVGSWNASLFNISTQIKNGSATYESTGSGSAALGANCPATTLTAPYTWLKVLTSDGSTGYVPIWK